MRNVAAKTIVPATFLSVSTELKGMTVVVPARMVDVAKVVRPRAEVRQGPSADFVVDDRILERGVDVVVLGQVGPWRHVLVASPPARGWVHAQALSQPVKSNRPIEIAVDKLPAVFAADEVRTLTAYENPSRLAVKIPRGRMFPALSQDERGALVWISETNSVGWIERRYLR